MPSTATRYEFVGTAGSVNLGNIVDFAGNSNFDKETLDADLVNPSFPDVETNDLVLAENGVLWKYTGTDELVSPDLSNEDFSGDWEQQTYFDVAELATVALADGDVVETDDGTLYEVSGSASAANLIGLDDPVFSGASSTETLTGSETLEAGDIVENTTTGDFYVYKGDNLSANTDTTSFTIPTATSSDWAKLSTFTIDHDLTAAGNSGSTTLAAHEIIALYDSNNDVTYYQNNGTAVSVLYLPTVASSDLTGATSLGASISASYSGAAGSTVSLSSGQTLSAGGIVQITGGDYFVYIGSTNYDGDSLTPSETSFTIPSAAVANTWLAISKDNRLSVTANDWVKMAEGDYSKASADSSNINHLQDSAFTAADYDDVASLTTADLVDGNWVLDNSGYWYEVIADESAVVLASENFASDTNYNDVAASDADQVVDVEAVSQVSSYAISSGDTIRAADGKVYDYSGSGTDLTASTDVETSDFTEVEANYDLATIASTEVDLEPGDTVDSVSGTRYTYRGAVASVDIVNADFTTADWAEVTADVDATTVGELSLNNGQYIVHSDTGNLYRYVGATGSVDVLSAFELANPTLDGDDWARVIQGTEITGQTIDLTDLAGDLTRAGAATSVAYQQTTQYVRRTARFTAIPEPPAR